MKPRSKKKRSRRSEAEQRHRLLERRERMGGPGLKVPKPRAPKAAPPPPLSGPAQVATQAYRDGWDAIWGAR